MNIDTSGTEMKDQSPLCFTFCPIHFAAWSTEKPHFVGHGSLKCWNKVDYKRGDMTPGTRVILVSPLHSSRYEHVDRNPPEEAVQT